MAPISSKKVKKTTKIKDWVPVNIADVFTVTNDRKVLIGGKIITDIELENLRAEVGAFKQYRLWQIFDETLKQKAIETGFILSENWEATQSGKMMLHNLGIMRSIMDSILHLAPMHTPVTQMKPYIAGKKVPK